MTGMNNFDSNLHPRGHHNNKGGFSGKPDSFPEDTLTAVADEPVSPDENIGMHLNRVDDGVQHWSSGNGSYTALVFPNGAQRFYLDGDLHRSGAPALIEPNGDERWFNHGTELPCPIPAPATVVGPDEHRVITTTGANFDENASMADRKRRVVADIQNSIRAGVLPDEPGVDIKVSVAKRQGFRQSLFITVEGLRRDYVYNAGREGQGVEFYTPEYKAIRDHLYNVADSYNQSVDRPRVLGADPEFFIDVTVKKLRL